MLLKDFRKPMKNMKQKEKAIFICAFIYLFTFIYLPFFSIPFKVIQ